MHLSILLRGNFSLTTAILIVTAILQITFMSACSGGADTAVDAAGMDGSRQVSDGVPSNLLPPPSVLAPRVSTSPEDSLMGSGFDSSLPNHRVTRRGNRALFEPGGNSGKGRGNSNGRFAFAIYHLTAPQGTQPGDIVTLRYRISPVESPDGAVSPVRVYSMYGVADADEWDGTEADTCRQSSILCLNEISVATNATRGLLVAIITEPTSTDSRDPSAKGGERGGAVYLDMISATSGWSVALVDEWSSSNLAPQGPRMMDADLSSDSAHDLVCFDGSSGWRFYQKRKLSEEMEVQQKQEQVGPNVSLALTPKGLPHVFSWDSRSDIGPVRWMAPESIWNSGVYADTGNPGEPYDVRRCMDGVIDGRGVEHVLFTCPGEWPIRCATRSPGADWDEQTVVDFKIDISGCPTAFNYGGGGGGDVLVVYRTSGSPGEGAFGKVFLGQRSAAGWSNEPIADVECPVGPDGSPAGLLAADFDRDGRLDVLCNAPEGVSLIHRDVATRRIQVNPLADPVTHMKSCAINSTNGFVVCYTVDGGTSFVNCWQGAPWGEPLLDESCARFASSSRGSREQVVTLDTILDPDDDGDGIPTSTCYMLVMTPDVSQPGVYHWTLEVRVNRWEAA